jgi:zinc D-Ala-D-Ala carboxypeptidase
MRITKHVSYAEATQTKSGIENIPSGQQMENIKLLCEKVFEPLREWVGKPIKINSIFRSVLVNNAIGGSKNSQHMAMDGCAMDIDDTYGHKTNAQMFNWIKENLTFDQMIWEFGDDNNPAWVHVSYRKHGNRKQLLKAKKVKGKTVYIKIK